MSEMQVVVRSTPPESIATGPEKRLLAGWQLAECSSPSSETRPRTVCNLLQVAQGMYVIEVLCFFHAAI